MSQAGRNRHEHICESLELFAKEVMSEFRDGDEARETKKLERLGPAIDAAMKRREEARPAPDGYSIPAAAQP